jgi:hypothetical protein
MNQTQFAKACELQNELDQLEQFRNELTLEHASSDWFRVVSILPDERRETILEMIRSELKQHIAKLEAEFKRL